MIQQIAVVLTESGHKIEFHKIMELAFLTRPNFTKKIQKIESL
jgi:hypothetical protein